MHHTLTRIRFVLHVHKCVCRGCILWKLSVLIYTFHFSHCDIDMSFFPRVGPDVRFSFRGTTYQNNSIVILEDIGEHDDALLCVTNLTACCRPSGSGGNGSVLGNWFFPNGTRVPSLGNQWNFYRTRGHMVVRMQRRRGGEEGIYRCEIPDTFGLIQTLYIGVYSASTGEWWILFCSCCNAHVIQKGDVFKQDKPQN